MELSKANMVASLPIREGPIIIRSWTRQDTYERARWPSYPAAYESFNFALKGASGAELDGHFVARDQDPTRVPLAIDHVDQPTIGYFALHDVDWVKRRVGNVALRIHSEWCGKGTGTLAVKTIVQWCRQCGMTSLRLDVSPLNGRAVRCYEKAGLVKVGELWRDAPELQGVDIDQEQYEALRAHYRTVSGAPQLPFWWMEVKLEGGSRCSLLTGPNHPL